MSTEPAAPASGDHPAATRDDRRGAARVAALCAVTIAVVAAVAQALPAGDHPVRPGLLALVGVLIVTAELYSVDIEFRRESLVLSFSSAPTIIGLIVLPLWVVLAMWLAVSLVLFAIVQRQPFFKVLANVSSHLIDLVVIAWILHLAGVGQDLDVDTWGVVVLAAVAGDAAVALFIVTAIALYQGRWDRSLLSGFWYGLLMAVISTMVAIIVVELLSRDDPAFVLVVALAGFLVIVTRGYAQIAARYQRLQLLDRFSQEMGEAVVAGEVVPRLLAESADIMHAERALLITARGDSGARGDSVASTGITVSELLDGATRTTPDDGFGAALLDVVTSSGVLLDLDGPHADTLARVGATELMASRLAPFDDSEHLLVVVDRSGAVRPFDAADLQLFETLAVHAGLALQNVELVDQLRDKVWASEQAATHDPLTALANRTLFQRHLDDEVAHERACAVLLIDLDRFKDVNDTLGHHNGDRLLIEVGVRLSDVLPADAVLARLGGDEFAVLLVGCVDETVAVAIADRIVAALDVPFELADMAVDVGGSVGVALDLGRGLDGPTLLRQADVAMYAAKADRSGVEVYSPDRDHYSPQRLALVGKLRKAIDDRGLELYYQPQVSLATGELLGAEALVRWPQPGRAPIPPDEFLYIAEHTGLIRPLTQLVLQEAILQAARWAEAGNPLRVSVNLSAHNLAETSLADEVASLLDASGLSPDLLRLELTESIVMSNPKRCVAMMNALCDVGVTLAIDDFGTGHSSLSYLTGLPATEMKIDKSFVFALGTEPAADTVVRSIIDLGRNLGLEVVAEGVETPVHAATLREMGCRTAQGYLFSRPLAVRGFELWRDDPERFRAFVTATEA